MEKRLIEDSLPLKEISEQSAREKSIRHGHISTLHLWWARRPLAACRAAVYASLVPAPKNAEERKEQHEFIKKLVNWDTLDPEHPDHWVIEEAKKRISKAHNGVPPKVLDPFAGGGSIPLEAQRLGCETYASDLNPVAHIIQLCTLYYPQKYAHLKVKEKDEMGQEYEGESQLVHDVKKWGEWVYEKVKEEIGHLYDTGNPDETAVAYIWAKTVTCPNPACRAEVPLIRQWWLCKKKDKKIAIKPVPNIEQKRIDFTIAEEEEIDFKPEEGTISKAKSICLCCNQPVSNEYIKEFGNNINFGNRLLAVAYIEKGIAGKKYRIANNIELEILNNLNIKNSIVSFSELTIIPEEPTPVQTTGGGGSCHRYGYKTFGSIFNNRQLFSLITFCKYIHQVHEILKEEIIDEEYVKAIITLLGCILDRLADKNASLSLWNSSGEKVEHVFGRQALPMVWDYAEANSLCSVGWMGGLNWVIKTCEKLSHINNTGNVLRMSANSLKNLSGFHAILTDPPYYDAVPYADLSDFFYVWLKRSIGFLYPEIFSTKLTPKRSEIIQDSLKNKTKEFFEEKMQEVFSEISNVLVDDGIFVLVYAHKSTEAWETLIKALMKENLVITSSWPLHTERPGRLMAQNVAALASSVFIVCRKIIPTEDGFIDDVEKELQEKLYERLDYFWSQNIRGADFFMSAIGPAVQVFGKYKKVYTLEGKELTVGDLLTKVRGIVSDFALERIVKGKGGQVIDEESRFYLLWRWAYGTSTMPAGEVIPMAQSLGVEFNELVSRSGLLEKKGDKVNLKSPQDRKKERNLGEPVEGEIVPLIDILHKAVNLWQGGDRQELANFISRACPHGRDKMEQLAQSIIDVLPDNDKEATLYVNFLTGTRQLPKAQKESGAEQLKMMS